MRRIFNKLFKKIGIKSKKIEHASDYYTFTRKMKENLQMYEEAIEKIKAKYKDDLDKLKRGYNRTNNSKLIKKVEKIKKPMKEELELAQDIAMLRAGNYSVPALKRVVRLERKYGAPERVDNFKNMIQSIKHEGKLIKTKSLARWNIAEELMEIIRENINPDGERVEEPKNWDKALETLEARLEQKGIALDGQGYDDQVKEVWAEVSMEMAEEREVKLAEALEIKLAKVEEIKEAKVAKELREEKAEREELEVYRDTVHEFEKRKENVSQDIGTR